MVFNRINFKHDKTFGKQVQLLIGVQQIIILATFVVRFEYVEKIGNVKVLFPYLLFLQYLAVVAFYILIEAVE